MRFDGTFEELKIKLETILPAGEWRVINENQHQFKTRSKGILNWYPSTGTLRFQGKPHAASKLQEMVKPLLESRCGTPSEPDVGTKQMLAELSEEPPSDTSYFIDDTYSDSELIIGLVGTIGTDLPEVSRLIGDRLKVFGYETCCIKISTDVIASIGCPAQTISEYDRISSYMEEGNRLRKDSQDNAILALGAAAQINKLRKDSAPMRRRAFIINSLKSPAEVERLRKIYSDGFFLIGVHADSARRHEYLVKDRSMTEQQASRLIERDADERDEHGQHTRNTYHLSDFFIDYDGNSDALKKQTWRILDLLFGRPYITPTFDEYAMFMAFSASLRSADLSRQVGAVLTKDRCIVATGANDVPKAHGGLYWPEKDPESHGIVDAPDGRDYMRGLDSNASHKRLIVDEILAVIPDQYQEELAPLIKKSRIKDITEYGRVVHAEMEALLSSARSGTSCAGSDLYCTTFPCHNCAKHIVAAGIKRVVYVEPYPKSKALEFHSDSISLTKNESNVVFEPFIGVGPRSFFNLFSTNLGSGYPVARKNEDGEIVEWKECNAKLRTQMHPWSYVDRESTAATRLASYLEGK